MEQLHRNLTRWEDQSKIENKRYAYSDQDELTGEYYDQVFPLNDNMCMNCAKKYKDREFVKKGQLIQKIDTCRFCGTHYPFSSNFIAVSLYVGRNTLKRYSRISQYNDTEEVRKVGENKLKRKLEETSRKIEK